MLKETCEDNGSFKLCLLVYFLVTQFAFMFHTAFSWHPSSVHMQTARGLQA